MFHPYQLQILQMRTPVEHAMMDITQMLTERVSHVFKTVHSASRLLSVSHVSMVTVLIWSTIHALLMLLMLSRKRMMQVETLSYNCARVAIMSTLPKLPVLLVQTAVQLALIALAVHGAVHALQDKAS